MVTLQVPGLDPKSVTREHPPAEISKVTDIHRGRHQATRRQLYAHRLQEKQLETRNLAAAGVSNMVTIHASRASD